MTDAEPRAELVRRRVIYSGRVQGVCFRATTAELSRGYKVTGYVRNMPDGTVELEAQGALIELDGFLGAIGREFGRNIADSDIREAPLREEEFGFRVTY